MKTFLTSKTMWFGLLQIAFAAVGFIFGWLDTQASMALLTTGLATIGIRFKTKGPIVPSQG
jgi:hypothetical protein